MTSAAESREGAELDLGEYCRQVEEHLTRVNGGHLVRVTGVAFELARTWAQRGIPLSVVRYGIDRKAERHRTGTARRPLRLEFCEGDVEAAFAQWRRAVGVSGLQSGEVEAPSQPESERTRRPSLVKALDRVVDRLVRASGRLDAPPELQAALGRVLEIVVAIREDARGARGGAREALRSRLVEADAGLMAAARAAADAASIDVRALAAADLAPYRARLDPAAWERSVEAGAARLLRERFGLPTLDPDEL